MTWIKFHGEIRRGKHRGIPRALRFVFLELAHEARPGRGVVELPAGMTLLDGAHDILGGDRREPARALELYTAGPDRDAPSLIVEGEAGALRLRIPSWEAWNRVDDSAERTREYRRKKREAASCDASRDGHATVTTSHLGDAPPVTVTAQDQIRSDQIRSEIPPTPQGVAPPPAGAGEALRLDPVERAPAKGAKAPKPETSEDRYRRAFVAGIHSGAPGLPYSLGGRLGLPFVAAIGEHSKGLRGEALEAWIANTAAEWRRTADPTFAGGWAPAAFVKWLNGGRRGGKVVGLQPPAKPGEWSWMDEGYKEFKA